MGRSTFRTRGRMGELCSLMGRQRFQLHFGSYRRGLTNSETLTPPIEGLLRFRSRGFHLQQLLHGNLDGTKKPVSLTLTIDSQTRIYASELPQKARSALLSRSSLHSQNEHASEG